MMKRMLAASLLLALAGSGVAMADDDCNVPMNQWHSREAVLKIAEARGWKVSRIKIDDGCYEIRGADETGRTFKAKIDPATLAVVEIERARADDDDDRDDRERERRRPARSGTAEPSGPPPSNGLFNTGEPPKTVVK